MSTYTNAEVQKLLRIYARNFPVSKKSKYQFATQSGCTIIAAKECDGTGGVRRTKKFGSCDHCNGLNGGKKFQTIKKRGKKAINIAVILDRRDTASVHWEELFQVYKNGIDDKLFTDDGKLLAQVSVAFFMSYFLTSL